MNILPYPKHIKLQIDQGLITPQLSILKPDRRGANATSGTGLLNSGNKFDFSSYVINRDLSNESASTFVKIKKNSL